MSVTENLKRCLAGDAPAEGFDGVEATAIVLKAHECGIDNLSIPVRDGAAAAFLRGNLKKAGLDCAATTTGADMASDNATAAEASANNLKRSVAKAAEKAAKKSAKKRARKNTNTGGPGVTGQPGSDPTATVSAEADDLQQKLESGAIKGAAPSDLEQLTAARRILKDPKANAAAKRVAAEIVRGIAEKAGNGGDIAEADIKPTKQVDSSDLAAVAKAVDDLEESLPRITDPVLKAEASHAVTRFRLAEHAAKSTYADNQQATNDQVRAAQERIQASPQTPSSASSRAQVGSLGSPTRLAPTGRIEEEPVAQLQRLVDELAQVQKDTKSGNISDRERDLRQQIARTQLALLHGSR